VNAGWACATVVI